jgi:hypothetical protein
MTMTTTMAMRLLPHIDGDEEGRQDDAPATFRGKGRILGEIEHGYSPETGVVPFQKRSGEFQVCLSAIPALEDGDGVVEHVTDGYVTLRMDSEDVPAFWGQVDIPIKDMLKLMSDCGYRLEPIGEVQQIGSVSR